MTRRDRPVLGPGREFDRIRAVASALGAAARGLGDDCALIDFPPGSPLVSTDVAVEHVHFRREWLTDEEIGWRAAAAALSDLAAMGATPAGLVAAVTMPPELDESVLVALMRGVGQAASLVGCPVLGGDLSRGSAVSLAITVFGAAPRPVFRSGARPGDTLWVSGALGGPRAALEALQAGQVPDASSRARFAAPVPRIALGQALAALGATSLIDLSDGLVADARHIAAASGVLLAIELERLPLADGAAVQARDAAPAVFAAGSGEEYELLVSLPHAVTDAEVHAAAASAGSVVTRIGAVVEGAPAVEARLHGDLLPIDGFDHFREPPPAR